MTGSWRESVPNTLVKVIETRNNCRVMTNGKYVVVLQKIISSENFRSHCFGITNHVEF